MQTFAMISEQTLSLFEFLLFPFLELVEFVKSHVKVQLEILVRQIGFLSSGVYFSRELPIQLIIGELIGLGVKELRSFFFLFF